MKIEKIETEKIEEKVKVKEKPKTEELKVESLQPDNTWIVKGLPSKGLLYPEGTVITARPLKLLELKMLSSVEEDNINYITTNVLSKCIRGINVNDLLSADKLFIIFWLRANTFEDSGFHVEFPCSKCKTNSSYHFSLDNLETKTLPDDFEIEKLITLPFSKDKITFKLSTVKDESMVENFKEKNVNNINMYMDDEMLKTAISINTINDNELTLQGVYEYISNIDPRDFSVIETYLKSIDIGIIPTLNVTCKKCGGMSPAGLTFRSDFFIPEYRS